MVKKNDQLSRREAIRQRQRNQQARSRLLFTGIAVVLVVFVGLFIWNIVKPPVGDAIEIMENGTDHVEEGVKVDYSTNPPTSGPHYAQTLYAGFFDETSQEAAIPNAESHIVHNLEHGYVVFWYNCSDLDAAACTALKDEIRAVIADVGADKVIAFPWTSISEVVVLTSWGQELRMDEFDADAAASFVEANRSHPRAPEPFAQ